MEKVWNDISLSTIHQHNYSHNHRTFHFQDFFSTANRRDPSPRATSDTTSFSGFDGISTEQGSSVTSTTLSLNTSSSDPDDHFSSAALGYLAKRAPNGICLTCDRENDKDKDKDKNRNRNRKRVRENTVCIETSDQRHKRLIKSRESADRARIKKQAYTIELEEEYKRLMAENDELKKNIDKLRFVPNIVEDQKRPILRRTLTALF